MSKTLALVGNPNSGKTTLFNNLTGSKQYVGNWPGVTVERKGGKLKKHDGFEVMYEISRVLRLTERMVRSKDIRRQM